MTFIRRLIEEIFIIDLKFSDLLLGWKLATNAKIWHNISKITPENTGT